MNTLTKNYGLIIVFLVFGIIFLAGQVGFDKLSCGLTGEPTPLGIPCEWLK